VTAGPAHPSLTVAVVYPDLLGTYGDGGNGLILARRASWRGIDTELVQADSGSTLPVADLYCIGGGEDGPQVRAAESLLADGTLHRAAEAGAVILGVCAGYQLLGRSFPDSADRPHPGLGLLDVTTRKGSGTRAVGELVASAGEDAPRLADGRLLPRLTGFENHGGVTSLGPGALPLAHVVRGVGNGSGDGTEGAWSGRVLGSYLHGPLLARNTALADLLLGWALASADRSVGATGPIVPVELADLDDRDESALRAERLAAAERAGSSGWRGRVRSLRR
jgi:lipid II isoglutaminyl synthase (glutamine-hydrolysing)